MEAKVTYDGGVRLVSTVDELDAILEKAHAHALKHPSMLELVLDTGDAMTIGLGRDMTVLNFAATSLDPPYYASVGDIESVGLIDFAYDRHSSEFPMSQAVPLALGLRAFRDFFVTGSRSEAINWEAV